uniref:Apoptosis regulator proteins, Bcl-2 family n=2 Tax=Schistocephalus solidus TaxID=70667 RepID=A0A0V0J917_SCHSO
MLYQVDCFESLRSHHLSSYESFNMEDKLPVPTPPPNNEARQRLGCGSANDRNSAHLSPALSSSLSDCSPNGISLDSPTPTPRCATLPGSSAAPPRSAIGRLMSEPNPFSYQHNMVPGLESVDEILRNKAARRTFQLLCSLVEPKMQSPNWCEPLLHRQLPRAQALIVSEPTVVNTDVTDGGGSRDIPASAVDPSSAPRQPAVPLVPRRISRLVLPGESTMPENISLEVKEAAQKLVDFFEARYSEKVGSLLDDALQVGTASEPSACGLITPSEEAQSSSPASPSSSSSPEMMLRLARLHYRTVLHELFAQQINWGRIIAMFSFLRALCQMLESSPPEQPTAPSSAAFTTAPSQAPPWLPTQTTGDAPIASVDDTCSVDQTDACYLSPLASEVARPQDKLPPLRGDSGAGDRAVVGRLDRCAVHYIIWTTEYIHEDRNLWNWIVNHNNWVLFSTNNCD